MAKTLLLADDSVTIQKVVSISFASEDVNLVTVDNGDDAVERARETRPDLILADVVMPGKSGYEVCEEIKADPDLQHIPVLLLSGTFEAFDEERAARAGAAGHVAKPFEAQALVDQVNHLLAASPPPAPAPAPAPAPLAPPEAVTVAVDSRSAESFDFFDDDLGELDAPAALDSRETVVLDDPESVFAFGDDELTPPDATPQKQAPTGDLGPAAPLATPNGADAAEPFPDRTVAILPDETQEPLASPVPPSALAEDPIPGELHDFGTGRLSAAADDLEESFLTGDASATSDEAFDFSFERESTAPEPMPVEPVMDAESSPDDLLQGTVLDPDGLAGFGIAEAEGATPIASEPVPDTAAPADSPTRWTPAEGLRGESIAEAEIDDPSDAAEPAERMPAEEPMELDSPIEAEFPPPPPMLEARPLPVEPAARAEAVLAEITPSLQPAVHDTLEKIAWESFGEVTEKIVHDVVDRIEKIAWEVIPQLTETLIKAEIRRLKDDDA